MPDNIRLIKNWRYIGVPPQSAMEQYAQFWHIEIVLRHCIFSCLRTSLGSRWKEALAAVSYGKSSNLQESAEKLKEQAQNNEEYSKGFTPNLIWFLTTGQLIELVKNKKNWDQVFHRLFLNENRKEISKLLDPLSKIRNQWAHFRPVAPQEFQRVSSDLLDCLEPVIANWTVEYFNPDYSRIRESLSLHSHLRC